jgi:hypothetical protein
MPVLLQEHSTAREALFLCRGCVQIVLMDAEVAVRLGWLPSEGERCYIQDPLER